MEKKNSCFRQGLNKALVSESRKSIESYTSKPKNARRRENANLSNSKPDVQRNSKPTKIRSYVDKRPRPRSNGNFSGTFNVSSSSTSSGLESVNDAEVALATDDQNDFEIELNSVYSFGSKKQNLNHLLNFHYSPRESDNSNNIGTNSYGRYANRNYGKKHKYNKEQFLQANFQFVINSGAEATINSSSPDTLVDWGIIEQINTQTTEEPQCPICLYPPVAAKLTRCGHTYCWPCILHYLALTDKSWRRCPICFEAVHLKDLKSTAIVQNVNFKAGDFITLQLMKRRKNSMFIEKVDEENDIFVNMDENKIPHLTADEEKKRFSKFILANSREILSILDREERELKAKDDLDCPEYIFCQQALNSLNERKLIIEKDLTKIEEIAENINNLTMEMSNINIHHHGKEEKMKEKGNNIQGEVSTGTLPKENGNFGKHYYFYQSIDGQNVFLHPLNVKMLQAMYGTLDKGPIVIEAMIVQKETQLMNEEERRKFTCLGHLPLKCEFDIVEVQLKPPIVSEEIFRMFKDDILLRQKTRMRRAREEKKREKEIDRINDRQMGKLISRSANIDIQSAQEFPACGLEEFGNSYNSYDENTFQFELVESSMSPQLPVATGSKSNANKISFANILSSPKKEELWPSLDEQVTSGNPSVSDIVWVKHKPSVSNQPGNFRTSVSESENSHDGFGDPAHYAGQNISDILAEALFQQEQQKVKNLTTLKENKKHNSGAVGNGCSKKNNKTKGKKTVLFSTGMNFNGNQK